MSTEKLLSRKIKVVAGSRKITTETKLEVEITTLLHRLEIIIAGICALE
jgi:hypothetical protein